MTNYQHEPHLYHMLYLAVPSDEAIPFVAIDDGHLERCSYKGLTSGWYDGLRVIDTQGNTQLVTRVHVLSGGNIAWRILKKLLNLQINVRLDTISCNPMSLDEIKQLVSERVAVCPWYEECSSDREERISAINDSRTTEELFELFL